MKWLTYFLCASITCISVDADVLRFTQNYQKPKRDNNIHNNGRYEGLFDKAVDMPKFLTMNGNHYTTDDGSLLLISSYSDSGVDNVGDWVGEFDEFLAVGTNITFRTSTKTYQPHYPQHSVVVFAQEFPDGLPGCSVGCNTCVSTGFPIVSINETKAEDSLGFLAHGYDFLGDKGKVLGIWGNSTDMANIYSGIESGPLVLFDDKFGMAQVITTFEEFLGGGVQYNLAKKQAAWGILGSVKDVPKGYRFSTISVTASGVRTVWEAWGSIMKKAYNRDTVARDTSLVNNYLGYATDNGAYYYYLTENGTTYEDTLEAVYNYSKLENIPYRYIQYDSWWYYQDKPIRAVYNWSARADIFPHGAKYLWEKHHWPILAHNRFWSNDTVYAKRNGGKFDFIIEDEHSLALPQDPEFWDYLFEDAVQWGMYTYLQDWLNTQTDNMNATVDDISVVKNWLVQMGNAASKIGINIFYCMAPSRHALQSLEIPSVATARVSDDYQPSNEQWRIGITNHFAHALGLAPTKDTWFSTSEQPGNPYNLTESYPALEAVVVVLSAGPVAPGDKINYSNVSLIKACCNDDGLILKPSVPARAISDQIVQTAYHVGPLNGAELWTTYSDISGWRFGIILAVGLNDNYDLVPKKAEFGDKYVTQRNQIYRRFTGGHLQTVQFTDSQFYRLDNSCTKASFCLLYTTPVMTTRNGTEILLLGTVDKWVPMSHKRVQGVTVTMHDIVVRMVGAVGEQIDFSYSIMGSDVVMKHRCVFGAAGVVELSILQGNCVRN